MQRILESLFLMMKSATHVHNMKNVEAVVKQVFSLVKWEHMIQIAIRSVYNMNINKNIFYRFEEKFGDGTLIIFNKIDGKIIESDKRGYLVLDAIQKGNNTIEKIIEETEIKKGIVKIFRGIISLCERVAASGNTSILLSA